MRYVIELHPECGPGEVWWIFDTHTNTYTDHSLSSRAEAEEIVDGLLSGRIER